jgi:drug/metabolite transporter (DMT)-like permease
LSTHARHRPSDYLPIAISVVVWAFGTPVFKLLQQHGCDEYSLVFYRTLSSALALTAWSAWAYPRELLETIRSPRPFLILGTLFATGLIIFIAGTYRASATLSILITRAIPLLTITFSAILFVDERRLIRRPAFLLGFLVALAGLVGLCLSKEDGRIAWEFSLGVGLLLLCALVWAVYSVGIKAWLGGKQPIVASLWVFWVASVLSLPMMLFFGHPQWILEAPPGWVTVLLVSGPAIMGLGESLYYVSIRRIGLGPSTSATLSVPMITAFVAWPVLGERPTAGLICFGFMLLAGLGLIIHARSRFVQLPADGVPEPVAGRQGTAAVSVGMVAVKSSRELPAVVVEDGDAKKA